MATRLVVGWGRIDLFSLLIPSCDTTIFHIGGLKNISGNATTSRYSIFFLVCTTFLRLELVALPPQQLGGGYFRQLHVGLLLHTFSMGLSLFVHPSIISRHATISSPICLLLAWWATWPTLNLSGWPTQLRLFIRLHIISLLTRTKFGWFTWLGKSISCRHTVGKGWGGK